MPECFPCGLCKSPWWKEERLLAVIRRAQEYFLTITPSSIPTKCSNQELVPKHNPTLTRGREMETSLEENSHSGHSETFTSPQHKIRQPCSLWFSLLRANKVQTLKIILQAIVNTAWSHYSLQLIYLKSLKTMSLWMLKNCSLNDGLGPCESQVRTFS